MFSFSKIFIFLFALLITGLAGLYSAHSSCTSAKNKFDKAKIEFAENLSELSHLATKIATMTKITFPDQKIIVKKIEFLQAKIEQKLTAIEMIKVHEILDKSLKSMLKNLRKNPSQSRKHKINELTSSFKIISERTTTSSHNFFLKAENFNKTFEGFFPKIFSSFIEVKPVQLLPPKKTEKK